MSLFDYIPLGPVLSEVVHASTVHANATHFLKYIETRAPNLCVKTNAHQPTLALVFAKEFNKPYIELNELERYLRSSIIDFETGTIVSRNPAVEANNFMDVTSIEINEDSVTYVESFEGTTVTLYHNSHLGMWYIATRKTFDAMTTYWKARRSIGEQVVSAIEAATGESYSQFLGKLSTDRSYTLTLTTSDGMGCIDYQSRFGPNYARLHFMHAWDSVSNVLSVGPALPSVGAALPSVGAALPSVGAESVSSGFASIGKFEECGVFYAERYNSLCVLSDKNRSEQSIESVRELTFEGVLIYNHTSGKVSKIQTDAYRIYAETSDYRDQPGSPAHIMRIYQHHNLDAFAARFPHDLVFIAKDEHNVSHNVSHNVLNAKGLVDIMFKLLSIELFGIFRAMGQRHTDVSRLILAPPADRTHHRTLQQMFDTDTNKRGYRTIFVHIRSTYHSHLKTPSSRSGMAFTSKNITDLLKRINVRDIVELWRSRMSMIVEIDRLSCSTSIDHNGPASSNTCPYETIKMVMFGIHKKPYVSNLLSMVRFVDEFVAASAANGRGK